LSSFHDALKPRNSKHVNGKPQTMATMPAISECHFTNPITKSTTAQTEKKARGVGRFISPALCASLRNLCDPNRNGEGPMSEMGIFRQFHCTGSAMAI
jgi:hypothetical protein